MSDEACERSPLARRAGEVAGALWLLFLAIPIGNTLSSHDTAVGKIAATAAAALFVIVYLAGWSFAERPQTARRRLAGLVAIQFLIAVILTLSGDSNWALMFIFVASSVAHLTPRPYNGWGVGLAAALSVITGAICHASFGTVIGYATPTLGIGMLMVLLADLRQKNAELTRARAELARMAVAAERERFARDLHDLLGHSLSVIALKSELAGRLVASDPEAAAREIRDVQSVARTSLSEVREAVSGYRRPTLASEIEGAQLALSAAGVKTSVRRAEAAFDPEVESVLAWAVREGATNVIRHAGAHRCDITVAVGADGAARVEIRDDGVGCAGATEADSADGNGLAGLVERATSLGGRLEAGPVAEGGFRLAMTLP